MQESDVVAKEIQFDLVVSREDGEPISESGIWDEFVEWAESKGYKFGGGINAIKEE